MTFDVGSVALPKWPAMVVVGESVTPEQAAEILVRTDNWHISTNDKAWGRAVRETVGLPPSSWELPEGEDRLERLKEIWAAEDRFRQEVGVLQLEYLSNSQIASCYVGGPHGWCDWTGRIGSANYNIGKWPGADTVLEEWERIAAAFRS
jgi:hypothetical protein